MPRPIGTIHVNDGMPEQVTAALDVFKKWLIA